MSHEYLTIAYVHSLKDEMESDSGLGGKDDAFPDGTVRRRTLLLGFGTFLIRAGTWLVGLRPQLPDLVQPTPERPILRSSIAARDSELASPDC